jgi:hypothetical protein
MSGQRKTKNGAPSTGGNMKNWGNFARVCVGALVAAGVLAAGCKSAPELSQADALSMIQAKYAQTAPVAIDIVVTDRGMQQGVTAKYWTGVKRFPNGYWADFKLTDDGKKLIELPGGGDTIQWRPSGPADPHYSITVTTIATSQPKVSGVQDISDLGDGKVAKFTEAENLDALPAPLQEIAQDPGNELSAHKQANFALTNGAWTLQSLQ